MIAEALLVKKCFGIQNLSWVTKSRGTESNRFYSGGIGGPVHLQLPCRLCDQCFHAPGVHGGMSTPSWWFEGRPIPTAPSRPSWHRFFLVIFLFGTCWEGGSIPPLLPVPCCLSGGGGGRLLVVCAHCLSVGAATAGVRFFPRRASAFALVSASEMDAPTMGCRCPRLPSPQAPSLLLCKDPPCSLWLDGGPVLGFPCCLLSTVKFYDNVQRFSWALPAKGSPD